MDEPLQGSSPALRYHQIVLYVLEKFIVERTEYIRYPDVLSVVERCL
jgi:hypothetical protein